MSSYASRTAGGSAQFGFVVWLSADPDVITARRRSGRHRFASPRTRSVAKVFDKAAAPYFREVADAVVETDYRTADEVARVIVEIWRDVHS